MEGSTACAQGAIIAASFSSKLQQLISDRLNESSFCGRFVAVRSSGTDEDSASHSFAGDQCNKICESQKILQLTVTSLVYTVARFLNGSHAV